MPVLLVSHTSETFGMYNPAYLTLSRHNIYYFRFPIPPSLHPQGKARDVKLSLKTRDPQEALRLARSLFTFADTVIQNPIVNMMEYHEIRSVLIEHFNTLLAKRQQQIHKNGQLKIAELQAVQNTHEMAAQALEERDFEWFGTDEDIAKAIKRLALPIEPGTDTLSSRMRKLSFTCYRTFLKIRARRSNTKTSRLKNSWSWMKKAIHAWI